MKNTIFVAAAFLTLTGCRSSYQMAEINRSRILVDARYDSQPDETAARFLEPFKQQVDSIMGPVVGRISHDLIVDRPESELSNLLADILMWAAPQYGEHPVLGVYNMGGIRANLVRGNVTYGDVLDVAPFENKIAFTTLSGETLMKLFRQIAKRGGEGLSHGAELVITEDGQLLSARLNGQEIDPKADYRVTTIDYLLGGNDGMSALNEGRQVVSPQEARNNTRVVIVNYFKEKSAKGELVDAKIEGRITIKR